MGGTDNVKLFVAIPVFSAVDPACVYSLMQLAQNPPCDFVFRMNIGDGILPRSRNTLAHEFLKTDCTHLLFIDADIAFTPEHVARIASHPPLTGLISGFYCKKLPGEPQWTCCGLDEQRIEVGNDLVEMRYLPTGFLRIARHVFESLSDGRCLEYKANGSDEIHRDFFSPIITDGRFLGEDYAFCHRWREVGGKCWADPQIQLAHIGPVAFPINTIKQEKTA